MQAKRKPLKRMPPISAEENRDGSWTVLFNTKHLGQARKELEPEAERIAAKALAEAEKAIKNGDSAARHEASKRLLARLSEQKHVTAMKGLVDGIASIASSKDGHLGAIMDLGEALDFAITQSEQVEPGLLTKKDYEELAEHTRNHLRMSFYGNVKAQKLAQDEMKRVCKKHGWEVPHRA